MGSLKTDSLRPVGGLTRIEEPVGSLTLIKEEPPIEPVPEQLPVEASEYAELDDGWYRDPDTGEKFEIKKGKRL